MRKESALRWVVVFKLLVPIAIFVPLQVAGQGQDVYKTGPPFCKPEQNLGAKNEESILEGIEGASLNGSSVSAGSGSLDTTNAGRSKMVPGKVKVYEPDHDEKERSQQPAERFHWKSALIQSGMLLGIQHGARLFQAKTTDGLAGPFFRDWGRSIRNLRGWSDGDSLFTNNLAHPYQGAATGRIFLNNSDRSKTLEFSKSKKYWESRFKAFVWSTAWSTQFEFGPISEANIGNVGLREKNGQSTMAWTDLVMTPVGGTGVLIGEDIVDKYVLKNWLEKKNRYRITRKIKILRSLLTPTTSFANLLSGKPPWKRYNR